MKTSLTAQGLSGTVEPKNGLPQGSVEAPTLFAMMLEPLMREIEQKHGHLGFNLGGLRIAIQAYADDMVLISETREGMQELLKVVGDYCQFSGLEIATGREKTASMAVNAPTGLPAFEVKDRIGDAPPQQIFDLGTGSYRYLGLRVSNSDSWTEEIKHRLEKLHADGEGLLAHNVSLRQMQEFALTFLQSAARWPGRYGIYDDVSCEEMDKVVRKVVIEGFTFSSNVSHLLVHTPKALHGLGVPRMADLQCQDAVLGAVQDLNSEDPQVRGSSRYVFRLLRTRGFSGRKIGCGLGLLLKKINSTPALDLTFLGPEQDEIERDIEVAWLRRTAPLVISQKDIDALCARSLDTMVKIKSWEQHTLLGQGLGRMCGQPPAVVDPLLAKVRVAMTGGRWAALEQELGRRKAAEVVDVRWPCLPAGVHDSVTAATDGSVIKGAAGSAFALYDGPVSKVRREDTPTIMEGKFKTLGRQSSNRSELFALLSCRTVQCMSVLCDSLCTIQQTDRGFVDPDSFTPGTANRT